MHFSSGINRPPYEAKDGFLQITSGCTHGTCKFCNFYKDSKFKFSPMKEIEEDIKELRDSGWQFDRIYLQGAYPLIRSYEDLVKIAEMIHKYLPEVETIGGYARVDNLKNKTVEQLKNLYELGYCYESARVINQLKPAMIYASELTLFPDTPLSEEVDVGTFEEATELERIQELQEFIRCLTTKTIFRAEHVTIPVPIYGKIPEDNEKMIKKLQNAIDEHGEENLRNYRRNIFGL